jgi:SAM-dependent methyltransferase
MKVLIKKYLPTSGHRSLRILNVGAATGGTSQMLDEFGEVTSVEYDKECCDLLKEKVGIKAVEASVSDLPFDDNFFDLVCAFDVIEHVENDCMAVQEIIRVAKNDAIIMITTPSFMFLWSHHDEINHHVRRYTQPAALKLLENTDSSILFKSYFNFFLFFPIAIFRIFFSNIFRPKKGTGSDFEVNKSSAILNSLLFSIFDVEKYILKIMALPLGVSLLFILKKNGIR